MRAPRHLLVAIVLLLAVAVSGCSGGTTSKAPATVPLQVVSASVQVDPKSYAGPCSGTDQLSFTATLNANASNAGGSVHFVWTINRTVSQGDVTFSPGELTQTLTQTYAYEVPADAGPQLRAAFATTMPNAVSAPDTMFSVACTTGFQVVGVSVTMQPWSTGCGPHTFGWSAILTAPYNNTGGDVHYSWRFVVGPGKDGTVTFAPGQLTAVVSAEQSYTIVSGAQPAVAVQPAWPAVTASQVVGALYVYAPNSISDSAALDHSSC